MKLSIAMITLNEEENLPRTLAALALMAKRLELEIIIIDSGSGDNTLEIARAAGAKIFQEDWKGYVEQKNSAFDKCSGEWVLGLDADEVLSPELAGEICVKILHDDPAVSGYALRRRTFYMGRLLRHAWQPDIKLRLARRAASPRWVGRDVHESLTVNGKSAVLDNYLIHYSYKDFSSHMETTKKLARVGAESRYAQGRRAGASDFVFRPVFHLFKRLVLKRAFLDGVPGLMAAWSGAVHSYMKTAFLWELQNKDKTGKQ